MAALGGTDVPVPADGPTVGVAVGVGCTPRPRSTVPVAEKGRPFAVPVTTTCCVPTSPWAGWSLMATCESSALAAAVNAASTAAWLLAAATDPPPAAAKVPRTVSWVSSVLKPTISARILARESASTADFCAPKLLLTVSPPSLSRTRLRSPLVPRMRTAALTPA